MRGLLASREVLASSSSPEVDPRLWSIVRPSLPAPDQAVYNEIARNFSWRKFGPAMQTVGYTTHGESDDWMYHEHHIIAMSPEVHFFVYTSQGGSLVRELKSRVCGVIDFADPTRGFVPLPVTSVRPCVGVCLK